MRCTGILRPSAFSSLGCFRARRLEPARYEAAGFFFRGSCMWQQVTAFLFDNNAIAGLEFENWMWVIGLPSLLVFGYFFERGFGRRTGDAEDEPPGE